MLHHHDLGASPDGRLPKGRPIKDAASHIGPTVLIGMFTRPGLILHMSSNEKMRIGIKPFDRIDASPGKPGYVGLPCQRTALGAFEKPLQPTAAALQRIELPMMVVIAECDAFFAQLGGNDAEFLAGALPCLRRLAAFLRWQSRHEELADTTAETAIGNVREIAAKRRQTDMACWRHQPTGREARFQCGWVIEMASDRFDIQKPGFGGGIELRVEIAKLAQRIEL